LPRKLLDLLERSESLYRRIARLDEVLFRKQGEAPGVHVHMQALQAAFGNSK
jgi:hypothetical protein